MKNVLRTIEETEGEGLADTVKKLFLLPDPLARYLELTAYYTHELYTVWSHGWLENAYLWIKQCGFKPWLGALCCVLGLSKRLP